jgi:hypothetical protein
MVIAAVGTGAMPEILSLLEGRKAYRERLEDGPDRF